MKQLFSLNNFFKDFEAMTVKTNLQRPPIASTTTKFSQKKLFLRIQTEYDSLNTVGITCR